MIPGQTRVDTSKELRNKHPLVALDSEDDYEGPKPRSDMYVCFQNEKDIRNIETIKIKSCYYTGIAVSIKLMPEVAMKNVLIAIEQDTNALELANKEAWEKSRARKFARLRKKFASRTATKKILQGHGVDPSKEDDPSAPNENERPPRINTIVNLRFEDCKFSSSVVEVLSNFLKTKQLIRSLILIKVTFEEPHDFKKIMEGVSHNGLLEKLTISQVEWDEDFYGKHLQRCLIEAKSLRELDISNIEFSHPKVFYDMCNAILSERCRLNVLKLRAIRLQKLEGKVVQYVMMKNKMLHTLDLSFCSGDNPSSFEFFLSKLDRYCNIRYFTLENSSVDISPCLESLGRALNENTKLEILILRNNSLKWTPYSQFWVSMINNRALTKINVSKTDMTDRVVEKVGLFLSQEHCAVRDIDLSKNHISDLGLNALCSYLMKNTSLKFLNLSSNSIHSEGMDGLSKYLKINPPLLELILNTNRIFNEGLIKFSECLPINENLHLLDIGKNAFNDVGFTVFAKAMQWNKGLKTLNISRNEDISDEGSLIVLAESLTQNRSLNILDLTGLKLTKKFCEKHLEPALRCNIGLKRIEGKIPPNIIDAELKVNNFIMQQIVPNYIEKNEVRRGQFNMKSVEATRNNLLNLSYQKIELINPAFKFIEYLDVLAVDFTEVRLLDDHMKILAAYVEMNPNLRSVVLDKNPFSDRGFRCLVEACTVNTKLAHISARECDRITDKSLKHLLEVISLVNTTLFQIDFTKAKFKSELITQVLTQVTLNKSIQDKLKPKVIQSPWSLHIDSGLACLGYEIQNSSPKRHKFQVECKFVENAPVAEVFEAVLKCYDIFKPNVIYLEHSNLNDEHLEALCDFLADKNRVYRLNLRRNKFSDEGAKILSKFICEKDQALTHIDLTRNAINEEGGYDLLEAVHMQTRLVEFNIGFGNKIPGKMSRAFEAEIKANNQIFKELKQKDFKQAPRIVEYKLIDKGPEFIRSAVKQCLVQKVLHLCLPDNMLSFNEARILSQLLAKNTPLKSLELQENCFDSRCAGLIANALNYNENLKALNLSGNKLGDLGVQLLVAPLIRKGLHSKKITEVRTPVYDEKKLIRLKLTRFPTVLKKGFEIKAGLRFLNVENNRTTPEILKQVQTLMNLNFEVCILVSSDAKIPQIEPEPLDLEIVFEGSDVKKVEQDEAPPMAKQETTTMVRKSKSTGNVLMTNLDISNTVKQEEVQDVTMPIGNDSNQTENKLKVMEDNSSLQDSFYAQEKIGDSKFEVETVNEVRSEVLSENTPPRQKIPSCLLALACFCRFRNMKYSYTGKDLPSASEIFCWRLIKGRSDACQVYSADAKKIAIFEKNLTHRVIAYCMIFNIILKYGIAVAYFFTTQADPDNPEVHVQEIDGKISRIDILLMLVYVGYSVVFEMITVFIVRLQMKTLGFNIYVFGKLLSGAMQRATFMFVMILANHFRLKQNSSGWILFVVLLSLCGFSQIPIFTRICATSKISSLHLLPTVERNKNLSQSTGHFAVHVMYSKLSIEPTQSSLFRDKEIEEERLDLTAEDIAEEMAANQVELEFSQQALLNFKDVLKYSREQLFQFQNVKFWTAFFVDLPLIIAVLIDFLMEGAQLDELLAFLLISAFAIIEFSVNLLQLTNRERLFIDEKRVLVHLQHRKNKFLTKYEEDFVAKADFVQPESSAQIEEDFQSPNRRLERMSDAYDSLGHKAEDDTISQLAKSGNFKSFRDLVLHYEQIQKAKRVQEGHESTSSDEDDGQPMNPLDPKKLKRLRKKGGDIESDEEEENSDFDDSDYAENRKEKQKIGLISSFWKGQTQRTDTPFAMAAEELTSTDSIKLQDIRQQNWDGQRTNYV